MGVALAAVGGLVAGRLGSLLVARMRREGPQPSWSRSPVVEVATALAFGLAVAFVPDANGVGERRTDLVLYLPLVWVLVPLSFIDAELKLLPNRIVLPSVGGAAALAGAASALGPGSGAWVRALAGGAASCALFVVLALVSPAGMGMGDVKLSAALGIGLAYLGWGWVLAGFMAAFLAAAGGGVLLLALRRGGLRSQIPFGPYLALGTMVAILFGEPVARAWVP